MMIVGWNPDKKHEALMRNRSTRTLRRGFTLVELLIVIIIIAVLAAVAIPKFASSSSRSKDSSLKSNLKIVRNAIEMFRADTGLTPATLADLAGTTSPSGGAYNNASTPALTPIPLGTFRGPYIQAIPVDPVSGTSFTYTVSTSANLGKVASSATGNDTDGNAYSGY
ncbi:prepilin-type N-terminal cleavage/methylation domain-containing protein [bacterium]|nr:MAG: prepilin-type N-terminal cleavage/methylation domain-containing protein [bacterium]